MKFLKSLILAGLSSLLLTTIVACGGSGKSAETIANEYMNISIKQDIRDDNSAQKQLKDLIHKKVENPEDSIAFSTDFWDEIDSVKDEVVSLSSEFEIDEVLLTDFVDAIISNIEIKQTDISEDGDTADVTFEVSLYTFDIDNVMEIATDCALKANGDETVAIKDFMLTCTEQINSKQFPQTKTLVITLKKDGNSWGITGAY